MIRTLLLALAGLTLSACSYGSAVDMTPMHARSASAIIASGDYCEAKGASAGKPFTVGSSSDCLRIDWNRATRSYTIVDDEAKDKINAAIAPLGGDLYLAQIEDKDDHAGAPDKYQIQLFIARGDAFLVLPVLDDKPFAEVVLKHPELTYGRKPSLKPDKQDSHPEENGQGRVYIAAGRLEDIKTFLRDVAREAVRDAKADEDKKGEISIGVRDRRGKRDHPANRTQTADIQAILKAFDALAN